MNSGAAREATDAGAGNGSRPTKSTFKPGVWHGSTLGSPIALTVVNKDYKLERLGDLERPRPGHGDLTGAIKYLGSIRAVLERASARETTVRVAAGALAKQLLAPFGIRAFGYVVQLGGIELPVQPGTIESPARDSRRERDLFALPGSATPRSKP